MTTSAPDSVTTGALRRVPVQGRSVARVQRMLDACAEILDEVGYEGLTTTLLAERAEVAIGSVYQFFPDKRAVVQALAERSLAGYLQRLTDRCGTSGLDSWWTLVAAGLDEYIGMHREVPGFRTLSLAGGARFGGLDSEPDHNAVIAAHLSELLVSRCGIADRSRLRFALTVAVEAADALIKLAFRRNPGGDEEVLAEAKDLVRDYLTRHLS